MTVEYGRLYSVVVSSPAVSGGTGTVESSDGFDASDFDSNAANPTGGAAKAAGQSIEFAAFRCVFTIRRGDFQTPNSLDLRIYNLADSTANALTTPGEFSKVVIQAGYSGNFGQIFTGTIRQIRKGRIDQKDSYIDITAADGDEAYNFATVNTSLAAGSRQNDIASILAAAAGRFGVTQGYMPEFSDSGAVRGQVFFGSFKDVARRFAEDNLCSWSIQDNALTFIPKQGYVPGNQLVISPTSGLIGVPEQTSEGVNVRVLLNPSIKIGTCIKLQDTVINQLRYSLDFTSQKDNALTKDQNKLNAQGLYYVMVAEHEGDTRGNPWYTTMTCLAVDATVKNVSTVNRLYATDGNPTPLPQN